MNRFGQRICLNMIVKNEAHVIRRCLDSLRGFIDAWLIVDTGSTDGTQEIIRTQLKELPGELVERPWVNFAHNRSEALELARGRGDYVFIIDADEILQFADSFELPKLDTHAYYFAIESAGLAYTKTQLVDNALDWSFKYVVHEHIFCAQMKTEALLPGVKTVRYMDGARSKDPLTYRRDALLLEHALLDEPNNARYEFYLAQSYREANDTELALRHYRRRVEMGGWVEEVWYSLYQIAELGRRRNEPWPQVLQAYLLAYQAKPDRAEPLFRIGTYYQQRGEFAVALMFFKSAQAIGYPRNDRLFVEKTIYDYLLPMEFAVACFYTGDDVTAIEYGNRLMLNRSIPPHLLVQAERNRRVSLDRFQPKLPTPLTAENRVLVVVPFCDSGPALDDCVDSLLEQTHSNFKAVFIDDGSLKSHAAWMPDDARFVFQRSERVAGFTRCVLDTIREHAGAGDLVLVMEADQRLADAEALAAVNAFFNERGCSAMYGQHRFSSGHCGTAVPIVRAEEFGRMREVRACVGPVIFRAGIEIEITEGGLDSIYHAALIGAGFGRAHFNDRPLVVVPLPESGR